MMKLTIIGAYGGVPAKNKACNGYLLETETTKILIECGSGTISKVQNLITLNELDAVIVSHFHYDHFSDLMVLGYAVEVGQRMGKFEKIELWSPALTEETKHFVNNDAFVQETITEERNVQIGDIVVSFIKTKHDKECYAMKFFSGNKTIGYTADTAYFEELLLFFKDVEVLIGESSLLESQNIINQNHMSTSEIVKLAQLSNAKTLVLTHFWYQVDLKDYFLEALNSNTQNQLKIDYADEYKVFES